MGLFLLISLSVLFGWAFTEYKNRQVEQLKKELAEEKMARAADNEMFQLERKRLGNTVKELLK